MGGERIMGIEQAETRVCTHMSVHMSRQHVCTQVYMHPQQCPVHIPMAHVHIDMCIGMCADMCVDSCMDMRVKISRADGRA